MADNNDDILDSLSKLMERESPGKTAEEWLVYLKDHMEQQKPLPVETSDLINLARAINRSY
ncbi:MAG: hypothetical protein HUU41_09180 [Bryobacteraceae bacterium]|nr:hypothetical protein [Bryobacterales bacterium]MEB2361760.1 hypothetical protein [Bryobacterales bacterium]NUN01274.1 hypothetical protein [Bryobacteraceae bacterium]